MNEQWEVVGLGRRRLNICRKRCPERGVGVPERKRAVAVGVVDDPHPGLEAPHEAPSVVDGRPPGRLVVVIDPARTRLRREASIRRERRGSGCERWERNDHDQREDRRNHHQLAIAALRPADGAYVLEEPPATGTIAVVRGGHQSHRHWCRRSCRDQSGELAHITTTCLCETISPSGRKSMADSRL